MSKTKSKTKTVSKKNDIPNLSYTDPLDASGSNLNFVNNSPFSADYIELSKKWKELPLYKNKQQLKLLLDSIHNNQVTLVISGTGSGKTVLVPKLLLKYFMLTQPEFNNNIVITNPKILTTIYNAEYSAKTLDVALGSIVGYKFRGSAENMVSNDTKLLYATDGLLLSQILKGDVLLSNIQGVIIDEVHERQVPIDLLLYFLKHVLKNRPEFKLIIMSATIDASLFKKFYDNDDITFNNVEISGVSNYAIKSHFMSPNDKINFFNFIDIGISIILKLLDETDTGDILMFVTSQRETEIGCSKLKQLCRDKMKIVDKCDSYYCAEVYGKMNNDKREYAINKDLFKTLDSKYKRKIIFATNVAESSLTLDGIIYVIDSGLELFGYFNHLKYSQILEKRYISNAQVKQRMGRAGRTQPGECYHLYTEQKFKSFETFPSPSIILANLNEQYISFFKNQIYLSNTIKLSNNLITPISPIQITSSIRFLHFNNIIKIVSLDKSGGSNLIGHPTSLQYHLNGGDTDVIDSEALSFETETTEEDKLTNHLDFKMIGYKNMLKIEDWKMYEGTLTLFGKMIYALSGIPIELAMLGIYGKILNIPMIYSIISILIAMDHKIDNLIKYPDNIQQADKLSFINDNFPDAITYFYSEHLFVYNLLINYYEMGNKLELLNTVIFDNAKEIKDNISKNINKIKDSDLELVNTKYNLIHRDINIDQLDILDKIYLAFLLSHRFNLIRLIDKQKKPLYQTQFYIENTSSNISFSFGKQLESVDADNYEWGFCSDVISIMGKTYMNGCTLFPVSIINKFKQYLN